MFWIHAGPHKTASSYIQDILQVNRQHLQQRGVFVAKKSEAKTFARHFNNGEIEAIRQLKFLRKKGNKCKLLSSEWLHPTILNTDGISKLELLSRKINSKIGLIFFIRDQASWINSMYCHTIRRLYHRRDFAQYAKSWCVQKSYWTLDWCTKFENLNTSGIDHKYIVMSSIKSRDPVEDLMQAIGFSYPQSEWQTKTINSVNIQPGTRGIWLSKICKEICDDLDVNTDELNNRGQEIRNIAIKKRWHLEKFYGFNQDLYNEITTNFDDGNKTFAEKYLNNEWQHFFPHKQVIESVYHSPKDEHELIELQKSLLEALERMNFPKSKIKEASSLFQDYAIRQQPI
ncbi:MAG: hypothetical protein CL862_06805 [Cyanobium sp. NAT70]|nr:hypothetical protein [Cyanobium sp. NAT70]|tara:strand:- start:476 stop:1504 length:1029 start_codon:yes stop_codon:yes gene_type:complete